MEVCGNQCRHRSSVCLNINDNRLWSLHLFHSTKLSSDCRKCRKGRGRISGSLCPLSRLPLRKSGFVQSCNQVKLSKTFSGNWSTREVFSKKIWNGPTRSSSTPTGMRHLFKLKFVLSIDIEFSKTKDRYDLINFLCFFHFIFCLRFIPLIIS